MVGCARQVLYVRLILYKVRALLLKLSSSFRKALVEPEGDRSIIPKSLLELWGVETALALLGLEIELYEGAVPQSNIPRVTCCILWCP